MKLEILEYHSTTARSISNGKVGDYIFYEAGCAETLKKFKGDVVICIPTKDHPWHLDDGEIVAFDLTSTKVKKWVRIMQLAGLKLEMMEPDPKDGVRIFIPPVYINNQGCLPVVQVLRYVYSPRSHAQDIYKSVLTLIGKGFSPVNAIMWGHYYSGAIWRDAIIRGDYVPMHTSFEILYTEAAYGSIHTMFGETALLFLKRLNLIEDKKWWNLADPHAYNEYYIKFNTIRKRFKSDPVEFFKTYNIKYD